MRKALVVLALIAGARPAAAQSIYTVDLLRDLPAGGNLFALIEAAQPEITTDRFNSGGLNAGSAEKAGAFLASWSQTDTASATCRSRVPSTARRCSFPNWRGGRASTSRPG